MRKHIDNKLNNMKTQGGIEMTVILGCSGKKKCNLALNLSVL